MAESEFMGEVISSDMGKGLPHPQIFGVGAVSREMQFPEHGFQHAALGAARNEARGIR